MGNGRALDGRAHWSRLGWFALLVCGCADNAELVAGRWVDCARTSSFKGLGNIAVASDGKVFVASRSGVLRSRTPSSFEAVGERLSLAYVAVDLQDHVYAAVGLSEQSPTPLRTSVDGGNTWAVVAMPTGFEASAIIGDPTRSGRVFLAGGNSLGEGGLFRSDDGGTSFTKISTFSGVMGVDGDGAIYLSRYDGIWCSDDQGATFQLRSAEPAGANLAPRFFLTDPRTIGHFMLGTQDGLYVSHDAGATWSRSDPGVTTSTCSVIYQNAARAPGSPNEIYMAVNAAGVYHSADNGVTWEPMNQGLSGDCLTPFGIGVAAGTDVVVYATGFGRASIYGYLAP